MEERILRELAELTELRGKFRDQLQAIENQMMVLRRVMAPKVVDPPTDSESEAEPSPTTDDPPLGDSGE